jgi:hypothetical protein
LDVGCRAKTVDVIKQSDLTGPKQREPDKPEQKIEVEAMPQETETSRLAAQVAEKTFEKTQKLSKEKKTGTLKLNSNLAFQLLD